MSIEQDKAGLSFRLILMTIIIGIVYFFSNFHRYSLGVISASLIHEFNLDHIQLGLLGSGLFYAYGLMQIPSGILSDKLGPRFVITMSCILTAAATLLFSSASGSQGLYVSRMLTGIAVAFVYVPALAIIRDWFSEKVFGTMVGILVAVGYLGALSTSVPLHLAVSSIGWRTTFRIVGYIFIVLCFLSWLVIRSKTGQKQEMKQGLWESSKEALKRPAFWSITLFFFTYSGIIFSFQGLWGVRFFETVLGREEEKAALLMAISLGCFVGSLLFGFLADRFGRFRVVIACGNLMTLLWILMIFFGFSYGGILLYLLCFIFGVLAGGGIVTSFSIIRYFSSSNNAGFLTGINGGSGYLGGAAFTQILGVFFAFSKTGDAASFRTVFLLYAIVCAVSTFLMMWLNRKLLKPSVS